MEFFRSDSLVFLFLYRLRHCNRDIAPSDVFGDAFVPCVVDSDQYVLSVTKPCLRRIKRLQRCTKTLLISRDVSISQQDQLDVVQAGVNAVSDSVDSLNEKSDRLSTGLENIQLTSAKTQAGVETLISVHSSISHHLFIVFACASDPHDRRVHYQHISMAFTPCRAI